MSAMMLGLLLGGTLWAAWIATWNLGRHRSDPATVRARVALAWPRSARCVPGAHDD
jgi:hypothetical protein